MGLLPFQKEKRILITRYNTRTNPEYGKEPSQRSVKELLNKGLINLDKPNGLRSHETAKLVQDILNVDSTGHGGTLDARVTGVLPVGLNKATRVLSVFLHGGKEYVCEMKLHEEVEREDLLDCFEHFTGVIKQLPPVRSSVKRVERERTVYYIKPLDYKRRSVLFRVGCEAGTYIRKLCTDMGDYLGVNAHMQNLRRTRASSLSEEDCTTLHDLQDAVKLLELKSDDSLMRECVNPMEDGVTHLKKVVASDGGVAAVTYGAPLMLPGVVKLTNNIREGDLTAVMSLKGELVSLGTARMTGEQMINQRKGIAVETDKVFVKRGTYPRSWKNE